MKHRLNPANQLRGTMRRDGSKLGRRLRAWLYGTFGLLFVSGLGWWLLHHFEHIESEFGPQPSPLEPWLLKLHGAAAMVGLIVLGMLIPLHLIPGWHARRNHGNGNGMVTLYLGLIITGYALYYAGAEQLRSWASSVHFVLGLTFPFLLIRHIVRGRRSRPPVTPNPANPPVSRPG